MCPRFAETQSNSRAICCGENALWSLAMTSSNLAFLAWNEQSIQRVGKKCRVYKTRKKTKKDRGGDIASKQFHA